MNHANIQKLHVVGHITGRLRDKLPDWTMSKRNLHLLLLAVLLTGCQMNTFTRKHFPERVAQIHTVALLPQVHTAMLNSYFGMDPSPAPLPEEPQIRSDLIASTTDQLQRRGFVVKEGSFPVGTNQIWDGRKIQNAFSTGLSKSKRPGAMAVATNLNVEGLFFLEATAYKSTPHREKITTTQNVIAALTLPVILIGARPLPEVMMQGSGVQVVLVDGKTGDLMWATVDFFGDLETNKPAEAVENLFTRYPKQKPSKINAT